MSKQSPLVLMILDGWGYSEESKYNAIHAADTPQWDAWWATRPHMLLQASGAKVGLPDEQMGNSEVGHMHLGAGRVVPQDFTRINDAIDNELFFQDTVLNDAIDALKASGKSLHVLGLLSPGGVHSHEKHLFAFLKLCAQKQFDKVCLHLFLDGRDTPPQSAENSLKRLNSELKKLPSVKICSLSGRYYAMDRDKRWERIKAVYDLLTENQFLYQFPTAEQAITAFYEQGIYDEFIPPTGIGEGGSIEEGDGVFFFNFRADRARQLTKALTSSDFFEFERNQIPSISHFITMTSYAKNLNTLAVFPPLKLHNGLGEILAKEGLSQLRAAETEKYAHVTFFFNGGSEEVFPEEDRILIPSPQVATYDLQPEMNALELTMVLVDAINSEAYDVIICNYANADMVGHSGNLKATVAAIECLDHCMQKIGQVIEQKNGELLITADHGNAEAMYNESIHQPHTAHTSEPVPLLYIGHSQWQFTQKTGSLIDVAPTILTLLDIPIPEEMTGQVLLEKNHEK